MSGLNKYILLIQALKKKSSSLTLNAFPCHFLRYFCSLKLLWMAKIILFFLYLNFYNPGYGVKNAFVICR